MRYLAVLTVIGFSSAAIVLGAACSSSSGGPPTNPYDAHAPADQSSPKMDAGNDAKTHKDSGPKKDAAADAGHDAKTADVTSDGPPAEAAPHDGATDATADGTTKDAEAHDGESDAHLDAHVDAGPPPVDYYFMGRWDTTVAPATPSQPATEWAGASVTATFTGTNIAIDVVETPNGAAADAGGAGFDSLVIFVDGTPTGDSPLLLNNGFQTGGSCALPAPGTCVTGEVVTVVANGLAAGNHTITITKATDPYYGGKVQWKQLIPSAAGSIVKKAYGFAHHIEWIGDDINVGRGINEAKAPAGCTNSNAWDVDMNATAAHLASDATESYVASVSNTFQAEYHNLSMATSGVYESLTTAPLIPAIYVLNQPDEMTNAWPFSTAACTGSPCTTWDPDLVVINVGSYGDFTNCTGNCPTLATGATPTGLKLEIANAYISLLSLVRSKHPTAPILLVSGNGYAGSIQPPDASNLVDYVMTTWVGQNAAEKIGTSIDFYSDAAEVDDGTFPYPASYTCGYYPDSTDQSSLATGVTGQTPADTGVQGAITALTGWMVP